MHERKVAMGSHTAREAIKLAKDKSPIFAGDENMRALFKYTITANDS
jgi:hypothetical protein